MERYLRSRSKSATIISLQDLSPYTTGYSCGKWCVFYLVFLASCSFAHSYQAKPLVLLSLLREVIGKQTELAVVFTSSVDSTHRLFRLLQLFGGEYRH